MIPLLLVSFTRDLASLHSLLVTVNHLHKRKRLAAVKRLAVAAYTRNDAAAGVPAYYFCATHSASPLLTRTPSRELTTLVCPLTTLC